MAEPNETMKHFNLHDLVRVRITSRKGVIIHQAMRQLSEFEQANPCSELDLMVADYDSAPKLKSPSTIADYYFYENGYLDIPPERTCLNFSNRPLSLYCDQLNFPMSFLIQMSLLSKGYSLVHAAGIEFEGKNCLFAAFGGTGKTILAAALLFAGGKLFGDDLVIVGKNEMLSYPQNLSVYPYHLKILRLSDGGVERIFKRNERLAWISGVLKPLNIGIVRAARRALDSRQAPCVSVPPRKVFGSQCFASRGRVDKVYYMIRNRAASSIRVTDISAAELTDKCTNILMHELLEVVRPIYAYAALFDFSPIGFYSDTKKILLNLFLSSPCKLMEIPQTISDDEFQRQIKAIISEK